MNEFFPMTNAGHQKLSEELEHLVKVEREKIKKAIQEARAHGDLKENSEYQSAKEKQSLVEGRILELQHKMAHAKVIDVSKNSSQQIVFGATVTLLDSEKDKEITYQIVGVDEADLKKGRISFTSPIAKALIGKEAGDTIVVNAPKGSTEYEILNVEYI